MKKKCGQSIKRRESKNGSTYCKQFIIILCIVLIPAPAQCYIISVLLKSESIVKIFILK